MNKEERNRTQIKQMKQLGSNLQAPFSEIKGFSPSSWKDHRMPNILWVVVLSGNVDREIILDYIRYVGKFVQENPECHNITLTGIAKLEETKQRELMEYMTSYSDEISNILSSMLLIDSLPSKNLWAEFLQEPEEEKAWDYLSLSIIECLDHQSASATDCRWAKVLCMVLGGKMQFHSKESVMDILSYPDYGDLRSVRPTIRATEIAFVQVEGDDEKIWAESFWKDAQLKTFCVPLPTSNYDENKVVGNEELSELRDKVLSHFFDTLDTTAVDAKHSTMFSCALYAIRLFEEMNVTNLFRSATARLSLRTLAEVYITLRYLDSSDDEKIWGTYREYGLGQAKLTSLKYDEMKKLPFFIDEELIGQIANEDKWDEFTDIELGHWDKTNLRKMSTEGGTKDIYDKYYDWTSGYTHGNWSSLRESVMSVCGNPLHRLHQIPLLHIQPLPTTMIDSVEIINKILALVKKNYNGLSAEIVFKEETIDETDELTNDII